MNKIQSKIRYGLILQGCVELALRKTKFKTFKVNPQYDEDLMTPDFLIPDENNPKYFIEVTQTDIRSNFQRKILRYFESVCESKVYFGSNIISVNILMGDPENELPKSNLNALFGFFDVNICPRKDCKQHKIISDMEEEALKIASDDKYVNVNKALEILNNNHAKAIRELAETIENSLKKAEIKKELIPLWEAERSRLKQLISIDSFALDESIKRPIIESLFLTDEEFSLIQNNQIKDLPASVFRQLLGKGLIDLNKEEKNVLKKVFLISEEDFTTTLKHQNPNNLPIGVRLRLEDIDLVKKISSISFGNKKIVHFNYNELFKRVVFNRESLKLNKGLSLLLNNPFSNRLRERCQDFINDDKNIFDFFLDIREESRRILMAKHFLKVINNGEFFLENEIIKNLYDENYAGISHGRCWMGDLLAEYLGKSHNEMNSIIFQNPKYTNSLANPFNNLTTKSPRLLNDKQIRENFIIFVIEAYKDLKNSNTVLSGDQIELKLATKLLHLRQHGAISLQNFNPLHLLIESICETNNWPYSYGGCENFFSDLSSEINAVGKFDLYKIKIANSIILVNALYVGDYGGLDKAKEWSARGRTLLYRIKNGTVVNSKVSKMLFVTDGAWKEEALKRLKLGGWDICRPTELYSRLIEENKSKFHEKKYKNLNKVAEEKADYT